MPASEEAKAERQHENIPHEKLLAARVACAQPLRVSGKRGRINLNGSQPYPDQWP